MSAEDTKKCPYCAETIKAEAIVCKHCGRNLKAEVKPVPSIKPIAPPVATTPTQPGQLKVYALFGTVAVVGLLMTAIGNDLIAQVGGVLFALSILGLAGRLIWESVKKLNKAAQIGLGAVSILFLALAVTPLSESLAPTKSLLLGLLVVAGGISWYLGSADARAVKQESRDHLDSRYCVTCGTVAVPKQVPKGSLGITLLLLFFFVLPGLIYEIWRYSGKKQGNLQVCPSCAGRNLVPLDTPIAQEALAGKSESRP